MEAHPLRKRSLVVTQPEPGYITDKQALLNRLAPAP